MGWGLTVEATALTHATRVGYWAYQLWLHHQLPYAAHVCRRCLC